MSKEKLMPRLRFESFFKKLDWQYTKLGEVADIVGGGTPSTQIEKYWNGDINWFSPTEIGETSYLNSSERKITKLGLKKSSAKILPIGTVLFTSRAGIGKTAILEKESTTNQGFQSIVPKKNILNSYFIYSRSEEIKNYAEIVGAGSTFVEVSGKQLEKMMLLIPELKEQQKIGSFFEKIDKMIQLQQSKVNKVKNIKAAYLSEVFPKEGEKYPEKRFEGFTDPWKETRLSDFVSKAVDNRGKTPPLSDEGTHPLIEVASIGDYYPNYSKVEKYLDDIAFDNNLRGYIKQNDILFSTVGRIGLVSLMDHNKDAAIAQNIVAFRATENNIPEYIYALLSAQTNKEKSERIVMGAVQPSIKVSQLENVKYLITDNIKEQQLIGSFFAKLENIIIYNQNHLIKLKELKKAYLNDMFV